MELWIFIVLCSGILIAIGFAFDLRAKKKKYKYELEEGLRKQREQRY
ncbi:hypothetical protein [Bacillus sp. T33-2]|nr:hypothetical protein [Bacillus sp. T33-2]